MKANKHWLARINEFFTDLFLPVVNNSFWFVEQTSFIPQYVTKWKSFSDSFILISYQTDKESKCSSRFWEIYGRAKEQSGAASEFSFHKGTDNANQ